MTTSPSIRLIRIRRSSNNVPYELLAWLSMTADDQAEEIPSAFIFCSLECQRTRVSHAFKSTIGRMLIFVMATAISEMRTLVPKLGRTK